MLRLAVLASHPVQYYAPLMRELARSVDLTVFYAHNPDATQQGAAFSSAFTWDVDLLSGYRSIFVDNVSPRPNASTFSGCDTPSINLHLREGKYDAVLSLGWYLKAMVQGIVAAKLQRVPVLVRGDSQLALARSVKHLVKAVAYPALLRTFDAVLPVGTANQAYYRYYGYPAERMFASPHCVDNAWFAAGATSKAGAVVRDRLGIKSSTPLVLFVGRLVPMKRVGDLIQAFAQLRQRLPAAHLAIAGSGPLEDTLKAEIGELGLTDAATFLGFVNQSKLPAVYAAANVLALPSDSRETWGLVCNEAIASGTPVVVSDEVGCAPDLSADPTVCRVHRKGNPDQLAEQLNAALANPPTPGALRRTADMHSLRRAADGVIEAAASVRRMTRS